MIFLIPILCLCCYLAKTRKEQMKKSWNKFKLLLWKNWTIRRRRKWETLIELLSPVLFCSILLILRAFIDIEYFQSRYYDPFTTEFIPANNLSMPPILLGTAGQDDVYHDCLEEKLRSDHRLKTAGSGRCDVDTFDPTTSWGILWAPENPRLEEIMNTVYKSTKICHIPVENEAALDNLLTCRAGQLSVMNLILAGVLFQSDQPWNTTDDTFGQVQIQLKFPSEIRYRDTIYNYNIQTWFTNVIYPQFPAPGPRDAVYNEGGTPGYYTEGFLGLQTALSESMLQHYKQTSGKNLPNFDIRLQRFPFPSYIEDSLLPGLTAIMSVIILFSFVSSCALTVKAVLVEKESQLKEYMKMMGLPNWLHWTTWYIQAFFMFFVSSVLVIIIIKAPIAGPDKSVLNKTDWGCVLLFFAVYSLSSVSFCFLMSSFFSKANTGSIVSTLLWFASYFPFLFMQFSYGSFSGVEKGFSSLLSNTAMSHGFLTILKYESLGEGLQWNTFWTPDTEEDSFTLGLTTVVLFLDAILYMLITIYIEAVFPGEYGVPLPWNYPFTKEYWFGRTIELEPTVTQHIYDDHFEPDPRNLNAGIKIQHLTKVYNKDKIAVNDLNLNMYEGQITVLLGHNGAGKTTTMSMLTGLYTPTSGTALIDDNDVTSDIQGVRENLGLCPQHNVLFDELTVKEHLYFYSKLKGVSNHMINREVNHYVESLELKNKEKCLSKKLSGGMQRKLSVGIALCGGSKVVLLDEPTAGMDPSARRSLWELLQKEKSNRTLLLSTHFMDEADVLGDRIAIMADGKLKCCGSGFFLKKKFGGGYRLIMVKTPSCDPDKVTLFLKKYITDIEIGADIGSELSYYLNESYSDHFEELFSEIEQNVNLLNILSYGVSSSTLEDVFIKVEEKISEDNESETSINRSISLDLSVNTDDVDMFTKPRLLENGQLLRNQIFAVWYKYFFTVIRSYILFIFITIVPVIDVVLVILITRIYEVPNDLPPVLLNFQSFPRGIATVAYSSNESEPLNVLSSYGRLLANVQTVIDGGYMTNSSQMDEYIMNESLIDLLRVTRRFSLGTVMSGDNNDVEIRTWFNGQPYHQPPMALSYAYNAIFNAYFGNETGVEFVNAPLPFLEETKVLTKNLNPTVGYYLALNLGFCLPFITSFFIFFLIKERVTKAKLLQHLSGLSSVVYWINTYVFNLLVLCIPLMVLIVTILSFQEEGMKSGLDAGRIFLLFLSYAFATLPIVYLLSKIFAVPAKGFTNSIIISVFFGMALFILITLLDAPGVASHVNTYLLDWFFTFSPFYSISYAFSQLKTNSFMVKLCKPIEEEFCDTYINSCCRDTSRCPSDGCFRWYENFFDWDHPGIGRNLTVFYIVACLAFGLLLIIDYRVWDLIRLRPPILNVVESFGRDSDVERERNLVNTHPEGYSLLLKQMTKYYGKFLAVNDICLRVVKGECFGLLGANGAGKTSLFKMLTGDSKISFGDAYVNGRSLRFHKKEVMRLIGYCPQFDALIDELTGRETLYIFCLLRGISKMYIKSVSEDLAKQLLFYKHIDKKVKEYSGGNKRKLSTAVALVGDPPVIYLDEPTTGMDPVAKRHLWNVICNLRNVGKTIILTSHSMEECEALCTRLAIMVNGEFKCLGSTQHLKNKFAQGYTLTVKIARGSDNSFNLVQTHQVKQYINEHFLKSELKEEYQGLMTFYIPSQSQLTWPKMFGLLESAKKQLNIEDYSLGQTSLEQVFLSFTKYQREI